MTAFSADHARLSRYAPHSVMAPHRHGEAWLSLVLRGGYEETIHARRQASVPGDLLLYPAHTEHSQCFGSDGALQVLLKPDDASLEYIAEHRIVLDDAPHLHGSVEALGIGARLLRELKVDDVFSPLAMTGLALEMVALFGRDNASRRPPLWLLRIKAILDEYPDRSHGLDALAMEAGYHPVHVAREFRRHFGRSIGDYSRRSRGEQAAELLRSTKMPLIEIAFACGYAGPSQLSRAFRVSFGMTPSQYRRLAR